MKKLTLGILMIIMLFIFTGCNSTSPSDNSNSEEIIQDEMDYEKVFESVSLIESQEFTMNRKANNGSIIDVLDDSSILLKRGNELFIWDFLEDKETLLVNEAWNTILSFDKSLIAYEDKEGIKVISIKDKQSKLIYLLKDEVIRNYIMSKDNKNIFLQTLKDNEFRTMVVGMDGNSKEIKLPENDNFVITGLHYFQGNNLYVTAQTKKEKNSPDEKELTTDLFKVNVNSKRMDNLTNLLSEDKAYVLDFYQDSKLLFKIVENKINEEGISSKTSIKSVNLQNGVISTLNIALDDASLISILSDEKEFIYLQSPTETNIKYPNMTEIKMNKNGSISSIANIYTDIPSKLFVHKGKIIFSSNGDLYIISLKDIDN